MSQIRILANDGIDDIGKSLLENAGYEVVTRHYNADELATELQSFDAITVRSATEVRKALIDACPRLKVIGRGGVGMDNIDVEAAKELGVELNEYGFCATRMNSAHGFSACRP